MHKLPYRDCSYYCGRVGSAVPNQSTRNSWQAPPTRYPTPVFVTPTQTDNPPFYISSKNRQRALHSLVPPSIPVTHRTPTVSTGRPTRASWRLVYKNLEALSSVRLRLSMDNHNHNNNPSHVRNAFAPGAWTPWRVPPSSHEPRRDDASDTLRNQPLFSASRTSTTTRSSTTITTTNTTTGGTVSMSDKKRRGRPRTSKEGTATSTASPSTVGSKKLPQSCRCNFGLFLDTMVREVSLTRPDLVHWTRDGSGFFIHQERSADVSQILAKYFLRTYRDAAIDPRQCIPFYSRSHESLTLVVLLHRREF